MRDFLKSWGLLLAALVVGVLAFFAATNYLSNAEEQFRLSLAGQQAEKIDVIVAAVEVAAGESVNSQNLAVAQLSTANLSGSVLTPDDFEVIDGSLLKVSMAQGEPLLDHFLEGLLIERFSELLKDGQRAVTIEVDTLNSNAGLLSVGDHVDIFLGGAFAPSSDDDDSGNGNAMIPLFQMIKVLAVDRHPLLTKEQPFRGQNYLSDEGVFDYSSVTLALKADDADNLAFSASLGDIVFLLRSSSDTKMRNWSALDRTSILEGGSTGNKKAFSFFGKSNVENGGIKAELRDVISTSIQSSGTGRKLVKSIRTSKTLSPSDAIKKIESLMQTKDASDEASEVNDNNDNTTTADTASPEDVQGEVTENE